MCFSCSFACAGALKFVLFARGAKRPPKQIHCKSHHLFMNFQCSRACRGRREEGTRGSSREPKQHTKSIPKTTKNVLFQGPGPSLQKRPPTNVKKSPPGAAQEGPGATQEIPRRPQERPKSAPRAAQRRSQSSLGGHLGPTWRPRGARPQSLKDSGARRDVRSSLII